MRCRQLLASCPGPKHVREGIALACNIGMCTASSGVIWAQNCRVGTVQGVQRAAGEALAAEAARLSAHFEALQARIEEAKSQAAAACQPMPREAKVPNPLTHDSPWARCYMRSHEVQECWVDAPQHGAMKSMRERHN